MKQLAVLPLLFACFCSQEVPREPGTVDTRAPIAVRYVASPELPVHEQPNEASPVMATYQNGEAISVLSDKGEWAEVRSGDGSGWAKTADLGSAQAKEAYESDPTPRFRVMPLPVSAPGAHGEVYIEADVNSDGDVISTRIITNTTGSPALASQNEQALKSAKFHPIIQKNQRTPFKYYHKVSY